MRLIASDAAEDDIDIEEESYDEEFEEEGELDREYLWGESQDAVEEAEGAADSYIGDKGDPDRQLVYIREILDEKWVLFYSFDEDGLYEAKYAFTNTYGDEPLEYAERAWNLYTDVCEMIIEKYGEPDASKDIWTDESQKEEYTEPEALAEDLMYSVSYWEFDDCAMKINVFEDRGDVLLIIDIIVTE